MLHLQRRNCNGLVDQLGTMRDTVVGQLRSAHRTNVASSRTSHLSSPRYIDAPSVAASRCATSKLAATTTAASTTPTVSGRFVLGPKNRLIDSGARAECGCDRLHYAGPGRPDPGCRRRRRGDCRTATVSRRTRYWSCRVCPHGAGTLYDPEVVNTFLSLLDGGSIELVDGSDPAAVH